MLSELDSEVSICRNCGGGLIDRLIHSLVLRFFWEYKDDEKKTCSVGLEFSVGTTSYQV